MALQGRFDKISNLVRVYSNWLKARLLGTSVLSKKEIKELKDSSFLSVPESENVIEKIYILGRLKSLLKTSDYKNLQYKDLTGDFSLSEVEKYIIEEAKLGAATHIKDLASNLETDSLNRFRKFVRSGVDAAIARDEIREKTALNLYEKQGYEQLAQDLASSLGDKWKKNWSQIAYTELQRAKVRGTAMAIADRVGIYKNSDGPNSNVSIVPNPDTCEDCAHHYLDSEGNPKVFNFKQLLDAGSNADPNVSHKRGPGGRHIHWKTTLGCLHPGCRCEIQYIPKGMGWVNQKLVVVDESKYKESIKKAVDQGTMSATIKPPGPKSTQDAGSAADKAKSPASIPGVAAPSNEAGPGRPSSGGQNIEWEYWKGDGQPPSEGGWEQSPSGKWRRPQGSGGGAGSPEQEAAKQALKTEDAKAWGKKPRDAVTVINHLGSGEIESLHKLGTDGTPESGMNESYRVTIAGNGRGLMKPKQELSEIVKEGRAYTEGCGTVPHGSQPRREAAAYGLFSAVGLDHCPPTTLREENGEKHSIQSWLEDYNQGHAHIAEIFGEKNPSYGELLEKSSDPEALNTKLTEITVVDLIMNSQDRHFGNLMFSDDLDDVKAIDHGVSFGAGMMGFKSSVMQKMASDNRKITIPETLKKNLETMSLGDLKRSMGDHMEDWEVGQTFLRSQYLLYLQENEGEIDYKKFQPYMYSANQDLGQPDGRMWVGSRQEQATKHMTTPRSRPNEMFEDFALDFLDKHSADPESPHHEAAKEMLDKGVFMGPGFATDAEQYRSLGRHKEYENKIRGVREGVESQYSKKLGVSSGFSEAAVAPTEPKVPVSAPTQPARGSSQKKQDATQRATPAAVQIERRKKERAQAATDVIKSLYLKNPEKPFEM